MKVVVPKKELVIINELSKFKRSQVEPGGPDYTREAPGIVYEGLIIKPMSCICDGAPDSSDRVRGLDDLSFFLLVRPFSLRLLKPPRPLPHVKNVRYFR